MQSLLVLVGLMACFGHALGVGSLVSAGALTVASPLPLVFTEKKGVETFALDFNLVWEDEKGITQRRAVQPGLYDDFHAPYAYRNVVGAAFSYGPILPENMVRSVLASAFRPGGELRKALGLEKERLRVEVISRTKGDDRRWLLNWEQP